MTHKLRAWWLGRQEFSIWNVLLHNIGFQSKFSLQEIEEIVANHLVNVVDRCNQTPGMFKLEMRSDQPEVNGHQLETLDFIDSVNDFWEKSFDEVSEEIKKHL